MTGEFIEPQLSAVETALRESYYGEFYLVEYNKATVTRHDNNTQIQIDDVGLTPVSALKIDYEIGDSTINNRLFIVNNRKGLQYYIEAHAESYGGFVLLKGFKKSPALSLLKKEDLEKDSLEELVRINTDTRVGKVEAEFFGNISNCTFAGELYDELQRFPGFESNIQDIQNSIKVNE